MALVEITKPTKEWISLELAKSHLRVGLSQTEEDEYIQFLIKSTRNYATALTGRAIMESTWQLSFETWPSRTIELPCGYVSEVSEITYIDESGDSTVLSTSLYEVDLKSKPAKVRPLEALEWPSTDEVFNAVTIEFVAGYENSEDIPEGLTNAMLLFLSHQYDMRAPIVTTADISKIPFSMSALFAQHRIFTFY